MQTKNVLTVMKNPNKQGGSYKRFNRIIKVLLSDSYTVHYFSNDRLDFSHSNLYFHKVPTFNLSILSHVFFIIFNSFQIIKFNIQNKVYCSFTFGGLDNYSFLLSNKIFGNPLITFIRNDWPFELQTRRRPYIIQKVGTFLYKFSLLFSSKILTVSPSETTNIKNITKDKIPVTTLPNEVPAKSKINSQEEFLREKFGFTKNQFLIGYIGRLSKRKNVMYIIDSFNKMKTFKSFKNVKLIIVGEGPERQSLENETKKCDLDNNTLFFDWQNNIESFLELVNVLVLPSFYEGCPNIVLEAFSRDKTVLGSNVKGIRDVLEHEDLMFNLDNPGDLSTKLIEIYDNQNILNKLQKLTLSRKSAFSFNWEKRVLNQFNF